MCVLASVTALMRRLRSGWASQIVLDATGKVPMYFRPPEGDVDNRVRAIAKVLGLQVRLQRRAPYPPHTSSHVASADWHVE